MNLIKLSQLIIRSEDSLVLKVLEYAKQRDYAKYTSTLAEAWRQSIVGLSEAIVKGIDQSVSIPELSPDDDFTQRSIVKFGIVEAQKHRKRGVSLGMFLGLMKYYHQSYIDLLNESDFQVEEKLYFLLYIRRFFDNVEMGFIMEWTAATEEKKMLNLQEANRIMTNEKNKYLTIFESIYDPMILVDSDNNIENINYHAAKLFLGTTSSGTMYYGNFSANQELDWLKPVLVNFVSLNQDEVLIEKTFQTKMGKKTFMVKLKKMMDISEKYSGTVILFNDITERLEFEKQLQEQYDELEKYAYTDPMTGVFNRRTGLIELEKEIALLGNGSNNISICFLDIDGLKAVNDTYGHTQGDSLIILIVSTLQFFIKDIGSISRMGGDEFLIILPNCTELHAETILKRVIKKLTQYDQESTNTYRHTFSYGIYEMLQGTVISFDEVIKNADEKMYRQKISKKNCVKRVP